MNSKSKFRVWLERLFSALARKYVVVARFGFGRTLNDALLHFALRGRGYNNCCDPRFTGELNFIRYLASSSPKLCIDVGANVGTYSNLILEHSSAHVLAFEPLPASFQELELLRTLYPTRVSLFEVGLGHSNTELELMFGENSELATLSPEVNQIDYVGASNTNGVLVKVRKLDFYMDEISKLSEEIDLLKIDTEGFEWEVILGAAECIKKFKPKYVQIEFNHHQLFKGNSLFSFASLLPGYRVFQMLPYSQGLVERNAHDPLANVYLYANFVFVRPDQECENNSIFIPKP
jgi:FkbM family methyltransferase